MVPTSPVSDTLAKPECVLEETEIHIELDKFLVILGKRNEDQRCIAYSRGDVGEGGEKDLFSQGEVTHEGFEAFAGILERQIDGRHGRQGHHRISLFGVVYRELPCDPEKCRRRGFKRGQPEIERFCLQGGLECPRDIGKPDKISV